MPLLKRLAYLVHRTGLWFGLHILPVHPYTPLPDVRELERTRDVWARRSDLPGLDVSLDDQVENLEAICLPYKSEYAGNRTFVEAVTHKFGPGYGYIEAQALHAVIRHFKPRRVIEVGSGVSTACILMAAKRNEEETGQKARVTCIEPDPSLAVRSLIGVDLLPEVVQTTSLEVFQELGENDFLFIDSTHTVIPGGDVNYIILEVLPRLRPGVVVHFHDIFFPYDYQPRVMQTFFYWAETSLLRAFFIHNQKVKILFCLSHLHDQRKDILKKVFPEYSPESTSKGLCTDYRPMEYYSRHLPVSIFFQTK